MSDHVNATVVHQNRVHCLESLRSLLEKGSTFDHEIYVLALGEIGSCISSEEEVNIILLRLVEYLGHSNALIRYLAFEQIQRLTHHSPNSALRLFEPYWRTIAVVVIKSLNNRPQMCQLLCDILGMNVPDFLKHTQFYTIPFLILSKNRDVLQRIADANGPQANVASICLEPAQLSATLAYLLVQPFQDPKQAILALLRQASPEFDQVDIPELFRAGPMGIAFELLKIAGDHEDQSKSQVKKALQILADNTPRRSNAPRPSAKKNNAVGLFFEEGALGIMQQLSDVISEARGPQTLSDRRRCVAAIHEMIVLARKYLCNALPQVETPRPSLYPCKLIFSRSAPV